MKKHLKNICFLTLFLLIILTITPNVLLITDSVKIVQAAIKQDISNDGISTYYVSNEKNNLLCLNYIKSNMKGSVEVIYSGKLAPLNKTNKYLRKYYYSKFFNSIDLYQDDIFIRSYNVASIISCVIKSIEYNKNKTITVKYKFNYLDTLDQSDYVINQINLDIKNNISNLKTDYEKALWAYQWVIDNTCYDFTYSNSSVYSGINKTGTVCRGYALLYNIITEKLGLNCRYVEGSIQQSLDNNHAWNIVEINGKWYCVDATWGDNVNYNKYFLKSMNTFSLAEYEYHTSDIYSNYIDAGEIFADTDNVDGSASNICGVLPSVYNIKMDILKINSISVNETYSYMLANTECIPIDFKSEDLNVATVDENGIIIGINKGTTIITAFNTDLNIEQSCKIIKI